MNAFLYALYILATIPVEVAKMIFKGDVGIVVGSLLLLVCSFFAGYFWRARSVA